MLTMLFLSTKKTLLVKTEEKLCLTIELVKGGLDVLVKWSHKELPGTEVSGWNFYS